MANHILVVKNEGEAVQYKKKYPTLLHGVGLFFPDDEGVRVRRKAINTVYYTASFNGASDILRKFPQCDGFVALSI